MKLPGPPVRDESTRAFEALLPSLDKLSAEIVSMPFSRKQKLGLAVLVAAHFTGTAAGVLHQLATEQGGPELDAAGWSEQIAKLIVDLTKKSRN